jgi:hypothetical protein
MSALAVKRLVVFIISQALGFILGMVIIGPLFNLLPYFSSIQVPQGRDIATYGYQYFFWTFFPIGMTIMIWMDAFLDTHILPD